MTAAPPSTLWGMMEMRANSAVLSGLPQAVQLIFGGSGIVPAAFVAILLNLLLPKEKKAE